ncbi:arsenic resistance N-acetyltransferase ArsN2 [Rhizobium leguminosarum]|uniref:arsenic resistance N-acetyltransferase ArsN2 n=1 Tax=Rhizobium leguminosarum TaxID=384 RepID=UPI00103EE1E1|nr:arsenic resistance N-acetyltransferase ArsN2 [Rhizobium leguminosarum]TCA02557.1 GNAT family N-acetyltransferase [Rhizobium leguminosarum bv. viciae]
MTSVTLAPLSGTDSKLRDALAASGLPTADLGYANRLFYCATNQDGYIVGYSGVEGCDDNVLLRSVVILPDYQGQNLGTRLVRETLSAIGGTSAVYLATTSAASFFEKLGFVTVDRAEVPADVLATQQLSSVCPTSATVMKLTRPPS